MKTYFKEFSMVENSLVKGYGYLEEVVSNRQEKFRHTAEYLKAKEEVRVDLRRILSSFSDEHIKEIEDAFVVMECICYSAAYKDGMTDLMAAMTFNQLGITKVEYIGEPIK